MTVVRCNSARPGVSLLEMMIALVIFATMVFPIISITTRATNQFEDHKNNSMAQFEWSLFFGDLQRAVGLAYKFFPLEDFPDVTGLSPNQQVFLAYVQNGQEKRVGYQLKAEADNPTHWHILFADIPDDASVDDYTTTSLNWKQTSLQDDYYLKADAPVGTPANYLSNYKPYFAYCRGSVCDDSITLKDADGMRVQSGNPNNPGVFKGVILVKGNSEIVMDPIYLKLASLQFNQAASRYQMMPFSAPLAMWSASTHWLGEKLVASDVTLNPVEKLSEVTCASGNCLGTPGNSFDVLPFNDMSFSTQTGELLAVTNSRYPSAGTTIIPAGGTTLNRSFYIYKFLPGKPDVPAYSLSVNQNTYEDTFPVVIKSTDAGWMGNTSRYLSVTQDKAGNIYVLVQQTVTGAAKPYFFIQKFSPKGVFTSQFNLGADVQRAVGITFNSGPGYDQTVLALVQVTTGTGSPYVIRGYNKDQNGQGTNINVTIQSPPLNVAEVYNGQSWDNAVGLDFDVYQTRYIVQFRDFTTLSLAPDLASARVFQYTPLASQALTDQSQGVAYDSNSNTLYSSLDTDASASGYNVNRYQYARIIPTIRLNPS